MASRVAVISRVDADSVQFELAATTACRTCRAGCISNTELSGKQKPHSLPRGLFDPAGAHQPSVGEQVTLHVESRSLIELSALVFLLPIILMLLLSVTCHVLVSQDDSWVGIAGLVGLLAGCGLARVVLERVGRVRNRALIGLERGVSIHR